MLNEKQVSELAHIYFTKYTDEEKRELRRDFLIQANTATAKKWAEAEEKSEFPELYYSVREKFFSFVAVRYEINL